MSHLFPWLSIILIGIAVGGLLAVRPFDIQQSKVINLFAFMGGHGLIIYLIYQPLLFGGLILVQMI